MARKPETLEKLADLVGKFCFQKTRRAPQFLRNAKKDRYLQYHIERKELPWYVLEL